MIEHLENQIEDAYKLIKKFILKTPLEYSSILSTKQCSVFLKMENLQITHSFKVRGALNTIGLLSNIERENGIITASTGNHGLAIAYALTKFKGQGTIYLPINALEEKVTKLKNFKINLEFYGKDSGLTELHAREISKNKGISYISPYNDTRIIAGQGTIAIELIEQLKEIDNIFITIGGGGLISGVGYYLKHKNPKTKIYGCLPINSPVMYESIKKGKIIQMETKETLSDGSAGGIEENSITFDLVSHIVDEFILVSEIEIKDAIYTIFKNHKVVIEGAAAVSVASFLKIRDNLVGNTVILLCGGNIGFDTFMEIINERYHT